METEVIGPFTVKALTVGEGLALLDVADDTVLFRETLLRLAVSKTVPDGVEGDTPLPFTDLDFGNNFRLLPQLMKAAMRLNGFANEAAAI